MEGHKGVYICANYNLKFWRQWFFQCHCVLAMRVLLFCLRNLIAFERVCCDLPDCV